MRWARTFYFLCIHLFRLSYETQSVLLGPRRLLDGRKLTYRYVYYSRLQLNQKHLHTLCNRDLNELTIICLIVALPCRDRHPGHMSKGFVLSATIPTEGIVLTGQTFPVILMASLHSAQDKAWWSLNQRFPGVYSLNRSTPFPLCGSLAHNWSSFIFGFKGASTSKVIGARNEMMMDEWMIMVAKWYSGTLWA